MSPEQAAGELDRLGPRSDVYSLGATLYCLLTAKPPLEGEDIGERLRRAQQGDFPRPRQHDPSIDKALEAVCLKAMALRPEDRYGSPRLLAEELERWMADEPVTAWSEPWTRTLLRWLTRHRVGVTGVAAAGLAALFGLGAVALVQTQAKAALAAKNNALALANARVTAANGDLKDANERVTAANDALAAANSKVEARYNLALDAIKTFHTGVSEDFLLKEDRFRALRDRFLKSASDFYGKLSARYWARRQTSRRGVHWHDQTSSWQSSHAKSAAWRMHLPRTARYSRRGTHWLASRGPTAPLRSSWAAASWLRPRCCLQR